MINPLISIIVPAYNYGQYLGHCIDSVLEQSYPNWELLVVNNGSTDNTAEVLARYTDTRIKKFHIEINDGPVKAFALAYEKVAGEYVALLPADDMFTPSKLERQVEYLKLHPNVDCLGTYVEVVDDQGNVSQDQRMMEYVNHQFDFTDLEGWRWKHGLCMPSLIYSKSHSDKAGKTSSDGLSNVFDWDFHVRLLRVGACFAVMPEKLTRYRWHNSNETRHRHKVQNQWIYSYTRTFLATIRELAPDPYGEMKECIKAIYLDPAPNLFLEEAPARWRCAYLEALLDPQGNAAEYGDYKSFYRYTTEWQVNSEKRAAIAAMDESMMELRTRLIRMPLVESSKRFPLERIGGTRLPFAARVRQELKRGMRRIRKHLGWGIAGKQAA